MGIEIPEAVKWVADQVVGSDWPEGDETAMFRLADYWRSAAKQLDEAREAGDAAAKAVLAGMKSEGTANAFTAHWKQFSGEDKAAFEQLRTLCEEIAEACEASGTSIQYTKLSIIAALVILAAQIAWMIAAAAGTFGASTAGIPVALLAGRTLVQRLLMQLVLQIAMNVGINLSVDVTIQSGQALAGRRDEWDLGKTGKAIQAGAIAGAAGGVVGGAGMAASARAAGANAGKYATKFAADDAGAAAAYAAGSRPVARGIDAAIGVNSSGFAGAARKGATAGAISGSAANSINTGINTGWDPGEMADAATSGAAGGSIGGATGGMATRHGALGEAYFGGPDPNAGYRVAGDNPQPGTAEAGRWSGHAQNIEYVNYAPNNGNDEHDDYPAPTPASTKPDELNLP